MQPHAGQPIEREGPPLAEASGAMILVHGRGASPRNILELAGALAHPGFTCLAPAAAGGAWYPYSFMSETASNEPGLSSALAVIDELVGRVVDAGLPRERIVLGGFSQGACLTLEFALRNATRYGGVLAFSGGLIGPPGMTWAHEGDFGGTPVFLGCSDIDPHIPKSRVDESATVLERMGADVEKRIYPGMGHSINEDELIFARGVVEAVGGA